MLPIERMYELAHRATLRVPTHPACDREDLVQCAVLGILEAGAPDEALAAVIARRRVIDEIRHQRGRRRREERPNRAALHEAAYLYEPLATADGGCLAQVLPAEGDPFEAVESRLDAARTVPALLRAVGRRAKNVLVWSIVQERSTTEIAAHYGVSPSRVSQIATAAMAKARAVEAARGRSLPTGSAPRRPRSAGRECLEATAAEKRAFGQYRRLQRAGLRRQEALMALPESERLLVVEYQRKCQRRARARTVGQPSPRPFAGARRSGHVRAAATVTAEHTPHRPAAVPA